MKGASLAAILSATSLLGFASVGSGQVPQAPQPIQPASSTEERALQRLGPSDPAEIEAFLDGLMAGTMKEKKVAGATVAVVREGQVIFAKGYGYADLDTHQRVDPERTLFRIGSVSKLFTWTAVMQLVEAGKLELQQDINRYLDFQIPATYPEPITLWHLMTHTPGFEDRGFALFSESNEPRGDFLARHMPARVRPPGRFSVYSNYGTALAGYIIERVSGEDWESYIERHILQPLGMQHTTGRQPLPAQFEADMSKGYALEGAALAERPFELLLPYAPAGSVSASATDMARFMIAHLQNGQLGDARILQDSTARVMHSLAFTHAEGLDGYDLGFYEQSSHGVQLIGHGGDTQWFHTNLTIAPEHNWGIFVSYNSAPGGELSFGPFLQTVLDHYYPVETPALASARDTIDSAYMGSYRVNRSSYTTMEKAAGLASAVKVARDKNPTLLQLQSPLGKARFMAAGPDLFHEVDGHERIAFRRDNSGNVTHLFLGSVPMMGLERLAWYETPLLHQLLLAMAVLLFLTSPIVVFGSWILHRRFRELPRLSRSERLARWSAVLVAVLSLGFVAGLVAIISNPGGLIKGNADSLNVVLAIPVLIAILALLLLWFAVSAWRHRWWGAWGRVHYTAVAFAAVLFTVVMAYWNLLGWRY